jgi:pSer/pThr/pTyr-binding forkhead associated (FHA) protein
MLAGVVPRLLVKTGIAQGRDHALGGACVVGRHPTVDFVIDDHLVSRRHFRLVQRGAHWEVEDLGSTNGTRLNGQRIRRAPLRDGDLIRAGDTELVFVQKDLLARYGRR